MKTAIISPHILYIAWSKWGINNNSNNNKTRKKNTTQIYKIVLYNKKEG